MVTKKCISDSHGKKTLCLIAPCARWFNCFLGVDKIDTLSVGNVSSAVLKGCLAGEEPITARHRWAYDDARDNFSSSTVTTTSTSTSIIGLQCRKKAIRLNSVSERKPAICLYATTHVYWFTYKKAP